jgi:hypothetical protein
MAIFGFFKTAEDHLNEAEKSMKEIWLKQNPGASPAAYDAMRAAEKAKKDAARQAELEMRSRDAKHWEDVAAGKIPADTPPPSQVAYDALPNEVKQKLEADKERDMLIREQYRHNREVEKQNRDILDAVKKN